MTIDNGIKKFSYKHLAIVGPTASGKSGLAHLLAKSYKDIEIVSVDSMQVYRYMNIGTAKPTKSEQMEAKYHMIDLVDPDQDYDLKQFQTQALNVVRDIEQRGKLALLVGGTGLYFQAVVDNLELPGQYPSIKTELERNDDVESLYALLKSYDPIASSNIEPNNQRRIIRALEVCIGSGRPFSSFGPGVDAFPDTCFDIYALWLPRENLNLRIANRINVMLNQGWLEEVYMLQNKYKLSRNAIKALGYEQLFNYLLGNDNLNNNDLSKEILDEIVARTVSFARRPRMWFRRDPRITWLGCNENTDELYSIFAKKVETLLSNINI